MEPSSPPPPPGPPLTPPHGELPHAFKTPGQGAASEGALSPDAILRLVVRHSFWVLLLMAIGPALSSLWMNRQIKWYQAQGTIVFDMTQSAALGRRVDVFDPYSDYFNKQELMETEFHIIRSQRVLRQVVADSGLDIDRNFLQSTFPNTPPDRIKPDTIADILRSRMKVDGVKGTHLAQITYEDTDPARAQRLVTTIIDTYIRVSNEDVVGTTGNALEWLREQVNKLQNDLETSEKELHDFKAQRGLLSVSLNDQNNLLRAEIGAIQTAVTEANIRRARLVSRANALAKVGRANPDDLPATELLSDDTLSGLRQEFIKARSELNLLLTSGKLENHPDVRLAQVRVDQTLDAFLRQVRNIQSAALREAAVVSNEAGSLQGLLDNARARALDLNLQEISYNKLQRSTSTNEKLYTNVLERMKEVDVSRMVNIKNIKLVEPPRLPTSPIRPVVGNVLAIGAGIGLLIGVVIAVLRELADRTIRTPSDLEQKLGVTCLGLLPSQGTEPRKAKMPKRFQATNITSESPELLVAREPMSSMAEAARSIRSNITFMSPDRPPRMLLVTSASPGEGKTTTATTLAISFAQTGARTLLLDLDLRRPRVHRIFGASSEKGISTLMLEEGTLDEVIAETQVPNLSVLPAGRTPPNPAEMLMSEKLMELLSQLRGRFDRIVIDSPPTNPITDAVILSTRVDGTLFVVRSYKTTIDQVRYGLRQHSDVNAKMLGVILNAVDLRRLEYKYSYYYRYYSGYGEYKPAPAGPKADS